MNYYSDPRVRALDKWYVSLNDSKMKAVIKLCDDEDGNEEEFEVPFKYEVCGICDGKGTHVNPSVDCDGLTAEDFAEDPGFLEDYMSGCFDQTCNACGGKRVEAIMDRDNCDPKILERFDTQRAEEADFRRMQDYERRMGC